MATSMFSISGLASGLDTEGIVSQLMSIERIPLTRYQEQQAKLRAVDGAWSVINTKLSGLRTALDAISSRASFDKHVTTRSSDSTVVAASKTGAPSVGGISFTVDRLATTHQVAVGQGLSGPQETVGDGTFVVTLPDGSTKTIVTDETTTLTKLKDAINSLGAGLGATIVQTGPGSHRLILSATASGAAGVFSVDGTPPGLDNARTQVLTQGVDAQLTVGSGAGAMVVTRSNNTITDLLDGVTLQLNKVSATAVDVTTTRDIAQTTKAVKDMVDAFTVVMKTIADYTKYDAVSKTAGTLQGNGDARRLASDLRAALMTNLSGSFTSLGDLGIGFDRYGAVSFDEAKLSKAMEKDYEGVVSLLSNVAATTSDPAVTYVSSSDKTVVGVYDITVTRTADVARAFSQTYVHDASSNPHKFRITSGSKSVDITLDEMNHPNADAAVQAIQNALTAAGMTNIAVANDAGNIRLQETRVGSSVGFTVANTGLTTNLWTGTQDFYGVDIQGTFGSDPTVFTGSGDVLTAASGDADGLSVRINLAAGSAVPAAIGNVEVHKGLLGIVSNAVRLMEGKAGRVQLARDGITAQIDRLDDAIAAYEMRLDQREITLRRKFSSLESALARMQSQGSWMASSVNTMNANTA